MQTINRPKTNRIAGWDWILIIGLTLAPMNEFRIWKIGPGEGLVMLWCLRYIQRFAVLRFDQPLPRFWILFLPVIGLGTGYCIIFYPREASSSGLLTYVYFAFISIGILLGTQEREPAEIRRVLYGAAITAAFWNLFLYFYAETVSPEFFSARIWYYNTRFSGGANNPHQVATLLSAVIFINIIHVTDRRSPSFYRALAAAATAAGVFIALKTKSSTLIVATVFSFSLFVYYLVLKTLKSRTQKWIATSVLVIFFALMVGIFREKLFDYIFEWIESDANGLGRFEIFASIGDTLHKNWLFGLGPGTHGLDGVIEYHNAYLEILAMGGVLGFALFVLFSSRLYRLLMRDPTMLFCVAPLYFYGLGAFSMRRLSFWIIVSLAMSYCVKLPGPEQTLPAPAAPMRGGTRL